jgi:hypothetical protein
MPFSKLWLVSKLGPVSEFGSVSKLAFVKDNVPNNLLVEAECV